MEDSIILCPECGSEESGYFCRNCGALLGGEDHVLCPRCHHIVPAAKYCNQCGQAVSGVGLSLRQLALAGDTFWITAEAGPAPAGEEDLLRPDESIQLSRAELPDWLTDLPGKPPVASDLPAAPDEAAGPAPRLYPKLGPVEEEVRPRSQRGFKAAVLLLMLVMLAGLALVILFMILRSAG